MAGSRILLASLAVAALGALPSTALAGSLVPPGNSAANQYTETFPTTGGNAEAKGKGKVTPGQVLGAGNAHKLDSQGKQGREAAAVVAATAPPAAVAPAAAGDGGDEGSGAGAGGDSGGSGASPGADSRAGGGGGNGTSGGAAGAGSLADAAASEGSGSSGFDEVLGQATGAGSSGGTGLLLPLAVIATAVWAAAFFLRRRRWTA